MDCPTCQTHWRTSFNELSKDQQEVILHAAAVITACGPWLKLLSAALAVWAMVAAAWWVANQLRLIGC